MKFYQFNNSHEPGTGGRWYFLILTVILSFAFYYPIQAQPLTPEDVLTMKTVSDAQISPDGQWIATFVAGQVSIFNAAPVVIILPPVADIRCAALN